MSMKKQIFIKYPWFKPSFHIDHIQDFRESNLDLHTALLSALIQGLLRHVISNKSNQN